MNFVRQNAPQADTWMNLNIDSKFINLTLILPNNIYQATNTYNTEYITLCKDYHLSKYKYRQANLY